MGNYNCRWACVDFVHVSNLDKSKPQANHPESEKVLTT
ncbi:MAG: hypothetical protein ACI8QC_003382 [Planctomycetota bacterium]|jgi:hypothetical protein